MYSNSDTPSSRCWLFLHVDHRWTGPAVLRQTSVRIVSTEENLLDAPEGFDERDEEIFCSARSNFTKSQGPGRCVCSAQELVVNDRAVPLPRWSRRI